MKPIEELFVKVAKHLLTQGARASASDDESTGCRYRIGGLRCAVGCLIDDAHYRESLEGDLMYDAGNVRRAVEGSIGRPLDGDEVKMLGDLQSVHDHRPLAEWPYGLSNIANRFEIGKAAQRVAGVLS